jgi:hypothetical protein
MLYADKFSQSFVSISFRKRITQGSIVFASNFKKVTLVRLERLSVHFATALRRWISGSVTEMGHLTSKNSSTRDKGNQLWHMVGSRADLVYMP